MDVLGAVAASQGVDLPSDYVEFMRTADGASGHVGDVWIELWPLREIIETVGSSPYEGVFLFAGDGANTIYGFDPERAGEIVEGDWIGLTSDELICHGHTFTEFLENVAAFTSDAG